MHTISKNVFWSVNCTLFFLTIPLNRNLIACMIVDISRKELCTRKYFQKESIGHIHEIIYRLHLPKGIHNVCLTDTMSEHF